MSDHGGESKGLKSASTKTPTRVIQKKIGPSKGKNGHHAAGVSPAPADRRTPLEYMLAVMNDPQAAPERRDRMAVAAAPFCHLKKGEGGKKDAQADAAELAAKGRFAPPEPPRPAASKALN